MPCVEVAEECQVQLLIEPEPELLIERFGQYLEFVGRIDSPWVGLNFDIGHAYCVGEDPQDWVARMAPHTRHYHFEDIAATRVHKHLIPGTGSIDFAATLRAIAADRLRWLDYGRTLSLPGRARRGRSRGPGIFAADCRRDWPAA